MTTLAQASTHVIEVIQIMTLKRSALIWGFPSRARADGFIELNGRLGDNHILKVQPIAYLQTLGKES